MIERRRALEPGERSALDQQAQQALMTTPWWAHARTVMLYLPIKGEVGTRLLAVAARREGKRLVLPRVQQEPRKLWLHLWSGAESELIPGAYDILEPAPTLPVVEGEEIDLAVVPGVAFDRLGNRLGYGGGYYDRTLPLLCQAAKVGLAYSFQVLDLLPAEPHDIRLDGVVDETGLTLTQGPGAPQP